MATIKEIAAFAGVSRGTVDRVLNNRGGVSQKTADKIRRIMEEQNFQPNLAGMALATQARRKRVGVILYAHDTNFYNEIEKGRLQQLQKKVDQKRATLDWASPSNNSL